MTFSIICDTKIRCCYILTHSEQPVRSAFIVQNVAGIAHMMGHHCVFSNKIGVVLHGSWCLVIMGLHEIGVHLTHCGLASGYGDADLGQHRLR